MFSFFLKWQNRAGQGPIETEAGLRNRVVTGSAPGMAAEDAFQREPEPLQRTIFAECLEGILGASGRKAAGRGLQRRDAQLVEFYQQDERRAQYLLQQFHRSALFSVVAFCAGFR